MIALVPSIGRAQRVGGYAGASLRNAVFAQEIALGGVHVAFNPDASSLYSNSAALGWLERPSIAVAGSSASFGLVGTAAIAAAAPIGRFAAVAVGLSTTSAGEQARYDDRRQRTGTFVDSEIGLHAGGSLAIGPGSVGATVRMLHRSVSGADVSNTGYAVDLGGTLEFIERIYIGAVVANVAGEMVSGETTLRERVPWEGRLNAAYMHPLEDRSRTTRMDPSGMAMTSRARPRSFILGAVGLRLAQTDSLPTLGLATEIVPIASVELGLRLGINTAGEISGGFLYRLPVEFTEELRLDYALRWLQEPGDVTHHVTVTAAF